MNPKANSRITFHWNLKSILALLVLIFSAFLLYFHTRDFKLTYLDDNVWILDYHWYLKDIKNVPALFTSPDFLSGVFYRPIQNLSFMLNSWSTGQNVAAFRISNMVVHSFNICFIFLILKAMKYSLEACFWATLIFCVHPLLTSAVVWIPGRTDAFLAFFVLLSFLSFLKYHSSNRFHFLIWHILCFILALLTKETAVAIPVMSFLYIAFFSKDNIKQKPYVWLYCCWALVIVTFLIIRAVILKDSSGVNVAVAFSSMLSNAPAMISYFGKAFLPVNVSVLPILKDLTLTYGFMAFAICVWGLSVSKRRRTSNVLYGFLWFLIFLAPSLVLSFLKHEYRVYIPLFGLLLIFLEMDLFRFDNTVEDSSQRKTVARLICVIIVVCFAGVTLTHSQHYKDRFAFWNNAVKHSPHSPLAQRNLGAMLYLEGDLMQAEKHFQKALELNPKERMAHNNLGLIYVQQKRYKDAEREYNLEININPTYDNVYYNLGLLYYFNGPKQKSKELWQKAVELNPKNAGAYLNLAKLAMEEGRLRQAKEYLDILREKGAIGDEEYQKYLQFIGRIKSNRVIPVEAGSK